MLILFICLLKIAVAHHEYSDYHQDEYHQDHHQYHHVDDYHGGQQEDEHHKGEYGGDNHNHNGGKVEWDEGAHGGNDHYLHGGQHDRDHHVGHHGGNHHYKHGGTKEDDYHEEYEGGLGNHRGEYHDRNTLRRSPGKRFKENQGFTNNVFGFKKQNSFKELFETNIAGQIRRPHSHQHSKRQVLHGPNKHSLTLDKGFFDENFPGSVESFEETYSGHEHPRFQNSFKPGKHFPNQHHNPSNGHHFQNSPIRFKRNRNKFQGNNQLQNLKVHGEYDYVPQLEQTNSA